MLEFQENQVCHRCKKIIKNKYYLVRCTKIRSVPHGDKCPCYLSIGYVCYNTIIKHPNIGEVKLVKKIREVGD